MKETIKNMLEPGDKVLHDGWLTVVGRECDGRTREIVVCDDAVAICIINGKFDMLLVKQKRPSIKGENKYTWEIPAGTLDIPGESKIDCAIREVEEETGVKLKADPHFCMSYYGIIGHDTHEVSLYTVQIRTEELPTQNEDVDLDVEEVKWFTNDEVGNMIKNGEIKDGKTIISWLHINQF